MFSLLIYSTFSTVSTRFSSFPACKPWKAELYYSAVEFRNLFQHHENTVSAPFLLSPPHICGGGTGDFTQPQPDGSNLSDRREIAPGRTNRLLHDPFFRHRDSFGREISLPLPGADRRTRADAGRLHSTPRARNGAAPGFAQDPLRRTARPYAGGLPRFAAPPGPAAQSASRGTGSSSRGKTTCRSPPRRRDRSGE